MTTLGRYQLGPRLAQGGMGELFLAVQRGPGGFAKPVAIKLLLPALAEDPALLDLFLFEARLVAGLTHPNICQTLDVGTVDGRTYIAMEYLAGQSLARVWRRALAAGKPLSPSLAAYVVACAAEGLGYAHEKVGPDGSALGIVHRDVSPQNLMVTYDGQVKVIDFGVARAACRVPRTAAGVVRGKLAYMSPEQVAGRSVDARADVFALGVILHELLAGTPLFVGDCDAELIRKVQHAPIPDLARMPSLPTVFSDVARQALERDLSRRLPSARELAHRLFSALRDQPSPPPDTRALASAMGELFAQEIAAERSRMLDASGEAAGTAAQPAVSATVPRRQATLPMGAARGRHWARWPIAASVAGAAMALALALHGGQRAPAAVSPPPAAPPEAPPQASSPSEASAPTTAPLVATPAPPTRKMPKALLKTQKTISRREVATETVSQPQAMGRLTLVTVPWSEVYLGDRLLGTTPLFEVELPAGAHRLRAVNASEQIDRILEVVIRPSQTTKRKEVF